MGKEEDISFLDSLNDLVKSDVLYFELDKGETSSKNVIGRRVKTPILNLYIRNKQEKIGYLIVGEGMFYNLLDAEIQEIKVKINKSLHDIDEIKGLLIKFRAKLDEFLVNFIVSWWNRKTIKLINSEIDRLLTKISRFNEDINNKQNEIEALMAIKPEAERLVSELSKFEIYEKKFWVIQKTRKKP